MLGQLPQAANPGSDGERPSPNVECSVAATSEPFPAHRTDPQHSSVIRPKRLQPSTQA
jgi:hypothetical protein